MPYGKSDVPMHEANADTLLSHCEKTREGCCANVGKMGEVDMRKWKL
jgi:hypothetical protein